MHEYDLSDLSELSDLEHIRQRPAMYVGSSGAAGLHHLFVELLDNVIDQYLAQTATTIRVEIDGSCLDVADDGPGLPFDVSHPDAESLAAFCLTELRQRTPTADGHTPHVHMRCYGGGLRIVTALTESCEVTARRGKAAWRQVFEKGITARPEVIATPPSALLGTVFRLVLDQQIFDAHWSYEVIEKQLRHAAYLFPGFRVQTPTMDFVAPRGLVEFAQDLAGPGDRNGKIWSYSGTTDGLRIQAVMMGAANTTQWHGYANGGRNQESGTHVTALKHVAAAVGWKPAIAMIHLLVDHPRFSGPTGSKLEAPQLFSPIYRVLKDDLEQWLSR